MPDFESHIDKLQSKLSSADFYRIFVESKKMQFCLAKDGQIETVKKESNSGISVFYTLEKFSYFYSTNNPEDMQKFQMKKGKIKSLDYVPKESCIKDKKELGKESFADFETVIKELAKTTKLSKNLVSNTINYYTKNVNRRIVCANTDVSQTTHYGFANFVPVAKEGQKIRTDQIRLGRTNNIDKSIFSFLSEAEELKQNTIKKLKYKEGLRGNFDVILNSDLSDLLAHEAFGHATESDLIYKNQSVLKGKLKQKIAPEFVSLSDNPTPKRDMWGCFYYDDEGFSAKKRELVKNGELTDLITTERYAQKLHLKNLGGARCESFEQIPIPRMSNTSFEQGKDKLENMIKEMKTGLVLKNGSGGQVNTATGVYQFGVKEAELIKNGEVIDHFVNITFGGNLISALQSIVAVSKEMDYSLVGFCGKDGQSVPVGGYGPNIKIKNVRVG